MILAPSLPGLHAHGGARSSTGTVIRGADKGRRRHRDSGRVMKKGIWKADWFSASSSRALLGVAKFSGADPGGDARVRIARAEDSKIERTRGR